MKTLSAVAILLLGAFGCATPDKIDTSRESTTSITATGTPGATVTAVYLQNGKQHHSSHTLPFTLEEKGVSQIELRKADPSASLTVETRVDNAGLRASYTNLVAPPGVPGVRVNIGQGFTVEQLKK